MLDLLLCGIFIPINLLGNIFVGTFFDVDIQIAAVDRLFEYNRCVLYQKGVILVFGL